MMLTTYWESWASSSAVSTAFGGRMAFKVQIRLSDPLLADRLVGVVRDRERIVEVDLPAPLGQGSRIEGARAERISVRPSPRGIVLKIREARTIRRVEAAVVRERRVRDILGVVICPRDAIQLPGIGREQAATA